MHLCSKNKVAEPIVVQQFAKMQENDLGTILL